MPINHEPLIVADSTLASSPQPESTMTPAIKRAPRIYGRRRDSAVDEDDTSLTLSETSLSSRDDISRTGLPDLDEGVPPNSGPSRLHMKRGVSDGENAKGLEQEDVENSPAYRFSFWDKMAEIEARFDEAERSDSGFENASGLQAVSFGRPKLLGETSDKGATPSGTNFPTHIDYELSDDGYGGASLPPISSPLDMLFEDSKYVLLPPKTPLARRRRSINALDDSRYESKLDQDGTPSSSKSPAHPHPIMTPKDKSSPTPPTSDDELPANASFRKGVKGKAIAQIDKPRSVPPLLFSNTDGPHQSHPGSSKAKFKAKSKIRAPTKKERKEVVMDRARLAAEQHVSITKIDNSNIFNLKNLFSCVKEKEIPRVEIKPPPSSDPIQPFSSPGKAKTERAIVLDETGRASLNFLTPESSLQGRTCFELPPLTTSDLEDLPDLHQIHEEEQEKRRKGAERFQVLLLETKKRILAQRAQPDDDDDDDDDGFDILPNNRTVQDERRTAGKLKLSEGRKRQLHLGGIGLRKRKATAIPESAELFSVLSKTHTNVFGQDMNGLTQADLNKILTRKVLKENEELTKRKEEEWVRRGGKVAAYGEYTAEITTVDDALQAYAEKGMQRVDADIEMDSGDDESESDAEWHFMMRGSASPSPGEEVEEGITNKKARLEEEEDRRAADSSQEVEIGDENIENIKRRHNRRMVIDSDDSDVENRMLPSNNNFKTTKEHGLMAHDEDSESSLLTTRQIHLPHITHRRSTSSLEDIDDENDKENDTRLMFDRSEDKENRAVVRHGVLASSSRPPLGSLVFSDDLEDLTLSPTSTIAPPDRVVDEEEGRKPLKDLLSEHSSLGRTNLTQAFARVSHLASPSPPSGTLSLAASIALAPFLEGNGGNVSGFSQFSQGDMGGLLAAAPVLEPDCSDLFGSADRARQREAGRSADLPRNKPRGLSRANTLDLTQDVALQPAFQVEDKLLRKADMIFEKEQAFVLEAANKKPEEETELYVNEQGFLTQTKPIVSPEVYRTSSPSQNIYGTEHSDFDHQSAQRPPLRTLSLSTMSEYDSPEQRPLQRLQKRALSPSRDRIVSRSPSRSPSSRKQLPNVYKLSKFSAGKSKQGSKQNFFKGSEFVEAEAQESDDDEMRGFGLGRGNKDDEDDDDDNDDLNRTLTELVDDQDMDEQTIAADLVLEKHKEYVEIADKENERYHQAVVHGEYRKKRRSNGVGMDDSDDESDEDERNKRIRRAMNKKRRIDRDDIKSLCNSEETKPFYDVYEQDLNDDDDMSFAYHQSEADVVMEAIPEQEDEDEDDSQKTVTAEEVRRAARELVQRGEEAEDSLDPHDVSWIDNELDDEDRRVRIKTINFNARRSSASHRQNQDPEFDASMEPPKSAYAVENERERGRMQAWYKSENKLAYTTARRGEGVAVTGHGKSKKGGVGLRKGVSGPASHVSEATRHSGSNKSLTAEASILAGVDRSARFG